MGEMIYWELGYVLSCILWGLFLMLIYDLLRIGRLVWKKGSIWVSVEDILYWSFAAIGTYRLFYQQDNGVIRWFAIAITFLVMLFMNRFISKWTVPFIGRILRVPVALIGRILRKITGGIQKIAQRIQKMAGISWKRLKFLKKKVTMKKAKEKNRGDWSGKEQTKEKT